MGLSALVDALGDQVKAEYQRILTISDPNERDRQIGFLVGMEYILHCLRELLLTNWELSFRHLFLKLKK